MARYELFKKILSIFLTSVSSFAFMMFLMQSLFGNLDLRNIIIFSVSAGFSITAVDFVKRLRTS